jgi:hypothetical protein
MSLQTTDPRRDGASPARKRQPKANSRAKHRRLRPVPPLRVDRLLDDQVLTFSEWRQINHLPERTGRRILNDPDPKNRPVVTQLSAKRWGVTVRHNREWQNSRAR